MKRMKADLQVPELEAKCKVLLDQMHEKDVLISSLRDELARKEVELSQYRTQAAQSQFLSHQFSLFGLGGPSNTGGTSSTSAAPPPQPFLFPLNGFMAPMPFAQWFGAAGLTGTQATTTPSCPPVATPHVQPQTQPQGPHNPPYRPHAASTPGIQKPPTHVHHGNVPPLRFPFQQAGEHEAHYVCRMWLDASTVQDLVMIWDSGVHGAVSLSHVESTPELRKERGHTSLPRQRTARSRRNAIIKLVTILSSNLSITRLASAELLDDFLVKHSWRIDTLANMQWPTPKEPLQAYLVTRGHNINLPDALDRS